MKAEKTSIRQSDSQSQRLRNFDPSHHSEAESALAEALAFVSDTRNGKGRWLSLLGSSGVGKTHLARGIREEFPGSKNKFIRWITVCDYMRSGDFGVLDAMADAAVLICDDIGAAYETDLSRAKIYELAERRINKPTVFTSNLDLQQVAKEIDSRVASRMVRDGSRVVQFRDCPDWAIANYKK